MIEFHYHLLRNIFKDYANLILIYYLAAWMYISLLIIVLDQFVLHIGDKLLGENEMIINESKTYINENPTFLDRLNRGDTNFNIYSGSKNYVVTKISGDRYKVEKGKGYDKASDAYVDKITNNGEVTKSALTNFIKMINKKMGYREDIDIDSEEQKLNEER